MREIRQFRGAYAFLSNYFEAPIRLRGPGMGDGITFPTNEHAFAAMKTLDPAARRAIALLPSPGAAKRAGRTLVLRRDWEAIKTDVMRALVRAKFSQHDALAIALVATDDAALVEGNTWNDRVWGVDERSGIGENRLGRILEEERARQRIVHGRSATFPPSTEPGT